MFINPKYPGITATELSIKNWVIAQSAPYVDSIRAIYSKDTAIDANEYRVAFRMLRTTTDPASGQLEDYHFWVQTNSGLWAAKEQCHSVCLSRIYGSKYRFIYILALSKF